MTVQQVLDTGRNDQHARLQGRITVEIDAKDFPAGQALGAKPRVALLGEFEKNGRKTAFEADRVTVLQ